MTITCDLLRKYARNTVRFDAAMHDINEGLANASIRNSVFKEANSTLSDAIYKAWDAFVQDPYFHAQKYRTQPDAVCDLNNSIMVSNLHEVQFLVKKLSNTKATGAAVDAMKEFLAAVLPLAQAVASLKLHIVMGRAPNAIPVVENPNKIIKTCPCCFRAIAVVGSTMAHHGYKRPHDMQYQTASCSGIRFKPLEVSSEGLEWLIGEVERYALNLSDKYNNKANVKKLLIKGNFKSQNIEITPESANWDKEFKIYCLKLRQDIKNITYELECLRERLKNWKPEIAIAEDNSEPVADSMSPSM